MAKTFDYKAALKEGYSPEEITGFLSEQHPDFNVEEALKEGYDHKEIANFLSTYKKPKGAVEKAGRLAGQYALGAAEMAAMPYEIGVMPLATEEASLAAYRGNVGEDIERLLEQKSMGDWDEQNEQLLEHLKGQIRDPEKAMEFVQPIDATVQGLAEKATGQDLHPEGWDEKSARFLGFIKEKPLNFVKDILKSAFKDPTKALKEAIPGMDAARSAGAALGWQAAEEGKFGPIGTAPAMIAGDVAAQGPKALLNVLKDPKKYVAQAMSWLNSGSAKKDLVKSMISEANDLGIKLDAGTLSDSKLVQWIQARSLQSGLSGDKLNEFQKNLANQFLKEYESTLSNFGDLAFENDFQAADAIKDALKVTETKLNLPPEQKTAASLRDRISVEDRPNYEAQYLEGIAPVEFETDRIAGEALKETAQEIKEPLTEQFTQEYEQIKEAIGEIPTGPMPELTQQIAEFVEANEGSLLLGVDAAESKVVNAARNLLESLGSQEGYLETTVGDLIKTKRTLQAVADYEFGGSKFEGAFKRLAKLVDEAAVQIIEQTSGPLAESLKNLDARYSLFKDTFENKNVIKLFEPRNRNYSAIYNEFVKNPDKMRALEEVLSQSPKGKQLLDRVKRDYAQRVISQNNVTPRDFANLSEILGPQFEDATANYAQTRYAQEALPRAEREERRPRRLEERELPRPTRAEERGRPSIKGRAKEDSTKGSKDFKRKKMYDALKNKTSAQIMKEMDSVDGIKKMRRVLNLTDEGKKLFDDLVRYKLFDLVDSKIKDSVTQNMKLGTFANLFKSKKTNDVVRELVGKDAYTRIVRLQKLGGKFNNVAQKFINASQSGVVAADAAAVVSLITGIVSLNPFLVAKSLATIRGLRAATNLLVDPKFLKELEKAALSPQMNIPEELLKSLSTRIEQELYRAAKDAQPEITDRNQEDLSMTHSTRL